ncbi:hypothetical protein DFH06DRAFT_362802 [Mycena polygramma]|nr:hypothetical protein DFH06DRAFT_362802 [Mycena polygramma]
MGVLHLETDRALLADNLARILHLKCSIAASRAENSILQTRLDSYAYPVLTLPNEIISEIFLHLLPPYPDCPPLKGTQSPTCLTQICPQWREIALATPALWRAIPLSLPDFNSTCEPHQRHYILDLWLQRSRSCPLSICIRNHSLSGNAYPSLEIRSTLLAHRTRWEYLRLLAVNLDFIFVDEPMPLIHLRIQMGVPAHKIFRFSAVPRLRSVDICGPDARNFALPWAHLTSLTMHSASPEHCVPILQQTLNLVHCELYLSFENDDHRPDVTLAFLESLVWDSSRRTISKLSSSPLSSVYRSQNDLSGQVLLIY